MSTDPVTFIQNRISDLNQEKQTLERVLGHLDGGTASRAERGAVPKRSGRARAPRGARALEMLEAIRKEPTASPGELAKVIGISSSQAYVVVRKLEGDGKLKRGKDGFQVIDG